MATRGVETDVKEGVMAGEELKVATSLPSNFRIAEILPHGLKSPHPAAPAPSLGPLAAFVGNFHGNGFNTIFRPNSTQTPTPLPSGPAVGDNVLELNLTSETLSFSSPLGSVPNRGMVQGDAFLNGVPYLQSINDVTIAGQSTGIHLEPGLWVIVPPTTNPHEVTTLVRMASIPHGTTILAQGTSKELNRGPNIPNNNILPFGVGGTPPPNSQFGTIAGTFTELKLSVPTAFRFKSPGVTQAMVKNPNSVLKSAIQGQNITHTTVLHVTTKHAPIKAGGTANTAFLAAGSNPPGGNAKAVEVEATFWIEKVAGSNKLQLQYSQLVELDFNGLSWPHVTVATLRKK